MEFGLCLVVNYLSTALGARFGRQVILLFFGRLTVFI
jgi:hypothetical protein